MKKNKKSLDFNKRNHTLIIPNSKKRKNMLNVQMIITALEKYNSYMYYAYSSDSLRSQDAKNLCEFIETALQSLIFTDSDDKKTYETAKSVAKLLNEALTYSFRLNYVLGSAKTWNQKKSVYNLIEKISELTFFYKQNTCDCGKPAIPKYDPCCSLKCWEKKYL